MPVILQDIMAKNLNANKFIAIDSGHLPMISKAKQLAGIISDFVNEIAQVSKKQRNANSVDRPTCILLHNSLTL
jgi:hypothetical protein